MSAPTPTPTNGSLSPRAGPPSKPISSTVAALCWVDNALGYRYGFLTWLGFWIPSFVVLLADDDTQGPARHFLAQGTLASSLTLLYFCYHFGKRSPASTPATVSPPLCAALAEWSLGRTMDLAQL